MEFANIASGGGLNLISSNFTVPFRDIRGKLYQKQQTKNKQTNKTGYSTDHGKFIHFNPLSVEWWKYRYAGYDTLAVIKAQLLYT